PIADGVDVCLLQKELWSEKDPIVSTRMHLQVSVFIGISAATASCPGTIVESSCWEGSNEALIYKDLVFTILPPSQCSNLLPSIGDTALQTVPSKSAMLALKLRFNLLKCHHKEEGYYTDTVIQTERLEELGLCLVTNFLIMALQDQAFEVVHNLDDLEHLMANATTPINLSIKASMKKVPVLRNYEGRTKVISATKALTYNALYFQLVKLGIQAGFEERLNPYCLRRMGANNMDESAAVSAEQRRQVMSHEVTSRIFSSSYLSPLIHADLMGVAMGRQESLDAVHAIGRMSLNADKEAPIALSVEGTARIWKLPEIQELLAIQDKAKLTCFTVHGTKIEGAKGTPEGVVYLGAYRDVQNAFRRHQKALFLNEWDQWFAWQDTRLMEGLNKKPPTNQCLKNRFLSYQIPHRRNTSKT
ncbi:hypothetical protein PAXINDRAFT_158198, partial [Paxillus involutus ATCC 200175]